MNDGIVFLPPLLLANATCGLTAGLVPPVAGCAWQPPQLSRFMRGPNPSAGVSASLKSSLPALKSASSERLRFASGAPAPGPARTPGSRACGDAGKGWDETL